MHTINKIVTYLLKHEGYTIQDNDSLSNMESKSTVYVKDVFGMRYKVTVEELGRTVDHLPISKEILYAKESIGLANLDFNKTTNE